MTRSELSITDDEVLLYKQNNYPGNNEKWNTEETSRWSHKMQETDGCVCLVAKNLRSRKSCTSGEKNSETVQLAYRATTIKVTGCSPSQLLMERNIIASWMAWFRNSCREKWRSKAEKSSWLQCITWSPSTSRSWSEHACPTALANWQTMVRTNRSLGKNKWSVLRCSKHVYRNKCIKTQPRKSPRTSEKTYIEWDAIVINNDNCHGSLSKANNIVAGPTSRYGRAINQVNRYTPWHKGYTHCEIISKYQKIGGRRCVNN